jgi:hypothetical protein
MFKVFVAPVTKVMIWNLDHVLFLLQTLTLHQISAARNGIGIITNVLSVQIDTILFQMENAKL